MRSGVSQAYFPGQYRKAEQGIYESLGRLKNDGAPEVFHTELQKFFLPLSVVLKHGK